MLPQVTLSMPELPETITLGAHEEARRLWKAAEEAARDASTNLVALCACLDRGIRAAEILAVEALQPVREQFPGSIAVRLEKPDASVDVARDAVEISADVTFAEIVDLLSEEALSCVGPGLHRGCEDRRLSCSRSRATAHGALGITLDAGDRDRLLMLGAYRNRIFRSPPPITLEPAALLEALPALSRLMERLLVLRCG